MNDWQEYLMAALKGTGVAVGTVVAGGFLGGLWPWLAKSLWTINPSVSLTPAFIVAGAASYLAVDALSKMK